MHSESKQFLFFLNALQEQSVMDRNEIEESLKSLGGVDGVIKDSYFIMGYENLAWYICKKLSLDELKTFGTSNVELLKQHSNARYFFTQALMEKPELDLHERKELILCMPEQYQQYLLRRFIG